MSTFEFVLLVAALLLAVWNAIRISTVRGEMQRLSFTTESLQSTISRLREELGRDLGTTRGHLARTAAGEKLDRQMILEGSSFADLPAAEAEQRLAAEPGLYLLDVRTPGEYARGHLYGAKLLPVDELERRMRELPADKSTPMLVYCASGGRSAAACTALAEQGYTSLYNLAGGIGAWRGPVEQGSALETQTP